jgi:hypothetical protein
MHCLSAGYLCLMVTVAFRQKKIARPTSAGRRPVRWHTVTVALVSKTKSSKQLLREPISFEQAHKQSPGCQFQSWANKHTVTATDLDRNCAA